MAIPFLSVKVGKKGKAQPHSDYIFRQGKYKNDPNKPAPKNQKDYEDLVYKSHGNMPAWAEDNPEFFWEMSDSFERKNGSTYREHVVALPREFETLEQEKAFINDWIEQELGDKHAYQYAIHNPLALDGKENRHVHLMFSERTNDGIERGADTYFKRYNSKHPEKGGAKKANTGLKQSERKELLKEQRGRFEVLLNKHLELANSNERISMKSLSEQGITDREPVNFSMNAYRYDDFKKEQKDFYDMRERVDRFREYRELKLTHLGFDIDKEIARFARQQEQKALEQEQAQQAIEEERRRLEREKAEQPKLHIDPIAIGKHNADLKCGFVDLHELHNDYIRDIKNGDINTVSDAVRLAESFYDKTERFQYLVRLSSTNTRLEQLNELKDMNKEIEKLSDNFSKFIDKKTQSVIKDNPRLLEARQSAQDRTERTSNYISECYERAEQPQQQQQAEHTINNSFRP